MQPLSNPRWERFAQEIAQGVDCTDAYVAAGFKRNDGNARTLRAKQAVSTRIQAIQIARAEISAKINAKAVAKAADALAIDKEWIMGRLKENVERALQAAPVRDAEGIPIGDYKYDGSVANRALELLGKEIGMFVDRSENKTVIHTVESEPMPEGGWQEKYATDNAATAH